MGSRGSIAPRSQRNVKKMEAVLLHQTLHTRCVDSPVMMRIHIRARGGGGSRGMLPEIFYIKKLQSGALCVFQNTLLSTEKSTILRIIFHNSKNDSPYQSPIPIQISMKVNTFLFCKGCGGGGGGLPP